MDKKKKILGAIPDWVEARLSGAGLLYLCLCVCVRFSSTPTDQRHAHWWSKLPVGVKL